MTDGVGAMLIPETMSGGRANRLPTEYANTPKKATKAYMPVKASASDYGHFLSRSTVLPSWGIIGGITIE